MIKLVCFDCPFPPNIKNPFKEFGLSIVGCDEPDFEIVKAPSGYAYLLDKRPLMLEKMCGDSFLINKCAPSDDQMIMLLKFDTYYNQRYCDESAIKRCVAFGDYFYLTAVFKNTKGCVTIAAKMINNQKKNYHYHFFGWNDHRETFDDKWKTQNPFKGFLGFL